MRYPGAQWRGPVPNQGGPIGQVRLGVMHIMEGTLAGTDGWFHNPAAQVSAHFGVGVDGTVYQWVDTTTVAWAEAAYNDIAISIEHEGNSGDHLTAAQLAADAALYAWLHTTSAIPLARTTSPAGAGWIGHGELGVAGGNHPDCPGSPILAQIPTIIALLTVPKGRTMKAVLHTPTTQYLLLDDESVVQLANPADGSTLTKPVAQGGFGLPYQGPLSDGTLAGFRKANA